MVFRRLMGFMLGHNAEESLKHVPAHPRSRAGMDVSVKKTLYRLKSGPNKGKLLGANEVCYESAGGSAQHYIATEAPYDRKDYYRMVLDTDARVLVSLTRSQEPRSHSPLELDSHHLKKDARLMIDGKGLRGKLGGTEIVCNKESTFHSPGHANKVPIRVRTYQVHKPGAKPYEIHHIIYKGWKDRHEPASTADTLTLVAAINESLATLGAENKNAVVVNCKFGQDRTNTLILKREIAHILETKFEQLAPIGTPPDVQQEVVQGMLAEIRSKKPGIADTVHIDRLVLACEDSVIRLSGHSVPQLHAFANHYLEDKAATLAKECAMEPDPFAKKTFHTATHSDHPGSDPSARGR